MRIPLMPRLAGVRAGGPWLYLRGRCAWERAGPQGPGGPAAPGHLGPADTEGGQSA